MKNKKMLYILIPATLIVWGLIILKIINSQHADTNLVLQPNVVMTSIDETVSDTFSINPDYRDPFLGKVANQNHTPTDGEGIIIRKNTPPPAVLKTPTPWPIIIYNGIIKNQKSNKEMVLLEINGQGYMMKVGETVNGVLLVKTFRDSVELLFSKEKKFIHK